MKKIDKNIVEKAFKSCTWGNTKETPGEWLKILENSDEQSRQRIFNILFREDADGNTIRSLFDRESICRFTSDLKRPFKKAHIEKKRKIWRYLYCGEKNAIPELDWIKPEKKHE